MSIIVYTKTGCLWSIRAMEYLRRNGISFEERDFIKNPAYRKEVEEKSGQSKSPTLDIDGIIVPNAGVEEVIAALANRRIDNKP